MSSPIPITRHTPDFATAPQLLPEQMQAIADLGFKTVVCNRPDFEQGPDQPTHQALREAAQAAQMQFFYLPVVSGAMTEEQAQAMADLICQTPAPMLAFCRSGGRSTSLHQRAQPYLSEQHTASTPTTVAGAAVTAAATASSLVTPHPGDRTSQSDDTRIQDIAPLPAPEHLIRFFPIEQTPAESLICQTREVIRNIMNGQDDRLLVVMGPCSIHDTKAALDYAKQLAQMRAQYQDTLEVVMRVYFEKPRTTVGWKGLINDPYLDESCRINEGLRIARHLLIEINQMGLPAASEFLDVISPQYIGDLISWGAIGARTTESQVHRELASALSAPIGFKNGTDGNVKIAIDAIAAARNGHRFLSIHKNGHVAIVQSSGNPDCHVILRGGKTPNYDPKSIQEACAELGKAQLRPSLMVDCSHANSYKQHERQIDVVAAIAEQLKSGSTQVFGVMVESHLVAGAQKFTPGKDDPSQLVYGQSITDACVGWEESVAMLRTLGDAVSARRSLRSK